MEISAFPDAGFGLVWNKPRGTALSPDPMASTALFFARPPGPTAPPVPSSGPVHQSGAEGAVLVNNSFNSTTTVVLGDPADSVEVLRRVYAQYLTKLCDQVWGPRATGQREKALRSVYARMFATESVAKRQDEEESREKTAGDAAVRTALLSVVAEHPRLAILGPPGGGKTTFLRHLAVFRALCNSLEAEAGPDGVARELAALDPAEAKAWEILNGFVPVWIELRNLQPPKVLAKARHPGDLPWIFKAHLDALRGQAPAEGREVERQSLAVTWSGIAQRLEDCFHRGQVLFLLDGLDEVTRPGSGGRGTLHQGIRDLVQWTPPGGRLPASNRVIVTCRERTWFDHWAIPGWGEILKGQVATLGAFSPEDRRAFLRAWFDHRPSMADAMASHLEDPRRDVGGRLSRMASVPLNLTMIAWLVEQREIRHQSAAGSAEDDLHLPPSRAAIYEQVVDAILWEIDDRKEFREPGERTLSELVGPSPVSRMKFVACLARVAFEKLRGEDDPLWREQDLLGPIAACLADAGGEPQASEDYRDTATLVLRTMQCRSGILRLEQEGEGNGRKYRFVHRSFLEYFAALHLVAFEGPRGPGTAEKARRWIQGRAQVRVLGVAIPGGEWAARKLAQRGRSEIVGKKRERSWEPLRLAAGYVAVDEKDRPSAYAIVPRGLVPGHERRETAWVSQVAAWLLEAPQGTPHHVWLAGELASEAGLTLEAAPAGLPKALVTVMQSELLSEPERVVVGRLLGQLGDPRPGVAPQMPPSAERPFFAWSKLILKGTSFNMGGDPHAENGWRNEPFHVVRTIAQDYRIARYPVTNAQYDHFEESEYFRRYATSKEWSKRIRLDRFIGKNQPVVYVDWVHALGFCEWINSLKLTPAQLGIGGAGKGERWEVRLPSEEEWEYAARGPEGRWLPWLPRDASNSAPLPPNQADLKGRCNWTDHHRLELGCTSPVGMYSGGESWCESADMVGNVWEWTKTVWVDVPPEQSGNEDFGDRGNRQHVVRGGSWYQIHDPSKSLRCAARVMGGDVYLSYRGRGFRVVCVRVSAAGG
jgi:formylglycine-generating enzyme required for sulfatase activity